MVREERQRSLSPQLARFSNDSPQLKQASTPLYRTRQPRYTSQHTSGHRQVVRHQLPKLTLAGSSPVARSSKKRKHGSVTLPCFLLPSAGTRTRQGASVKQTRSVCSEQARSPIGDRSRCGFAKQIRGRPVARSIDQGGFWEKRIQPTLSPLPRTGTCRLKPVRICEANTRTSRCPPPLQNVRLMPATHTCIRSRYNGWVTTNVPITKKEPL